MGEQHDNWCWRRLNASEFNIRLPSRVSITSVFFSSLLIFTAITGLVMFFVFLAFHSQDLGNAGIRTAALIAGSIVSAVIIISGWAVNHKLVATRNKEQHTFESVASTRLSETFQKHVIERRALTRSYPELMVVKDELNSFVGFKALSCEQPNLKEGLNSLLYLLNYYEFLASTVKRGAFDEAFMRDMVSGIVVELVEYAAPLIDSYQQGFKDESGTYINATPRAFENVVGLALYWSDTE